MVALFVVATIIVFLVVDYFVQRAAKRKAVAAPVAEASAKARFIIPKGYFFGRGHTWVEQLSNGMVRVGLDDFVQKIVGRVDGINFVEAANNLSRGDRLFTIRQGDKEMSFRSPISGKIVAFNEELTSSLALLNKEPYKQGWVVIVEPADSEKEFRLMARGNEAAQWVKEEIKRFRNFITSQSTGSPALAGVTLMDGGVPVDGVMEHSSKEAWEKFEKNFLANDDAGSGTNY